MYAPNGCAGGVEIAPQGFGRAVLLTVEEEEAGAPHGRIFPVLLDD